MISVLFFEVMYLFFYGWFLRHIFYVWYVVC